MINQNELPFDTGDWKDLYTFSKLYDEDVRSFLEKTSPQLHCSTGVVCGLLATNGSSRIPKESEVFQCSHDKSSGLKDTVWCPDAANVVFDVSASANEETCDSHTLCPTCLSCLRGSKKRIPKLSRVNVPIATPVDILKNLSFMEQLLISPILPMIFVWRYRGYGQF